MRREAGSGRCGRAWSVRVLCSSPQAGRVSGHEPERTDGLQLSLQPAHEQQLRADEHPGAALQRDGQHGEQLHR